MTMFNRTDRAPDPVPTTKPATPITAVPPPAPQPTPAPVEMRRPAPASSGHTATVSVISKSLKITGQLESTEDINIEGEVDGDVRGVSVKVGHNAKVKGTITAEEVELAGTVTGKIEARKIVLTSTARMTGDLIHQDLRVDSGAYLEGHCRPEYGKTDAKVHTVKPTVTAAPLARAN